MSNSIVNTGNLGWDIKDRLIRASVVLQTRAPFYSYIILNMRIEKAEDNKVPTAAINRYGDLYYNSEWLSKLTDEQIIFVLCHEASHVSTLTFDRLGPRDMLLWNIATDMVINWMLIQDGFTPPEDGLIPDKLGIYELKTADGVIDIDANDKIAEEIYTELENKLPKITMCGCGSGEGSGDGEGLSGLGFDQHIYEEESQDGQDDQGRTHSTSEKTANAEKWKKIAVSAATAAKMRGKASSIMEREIDELLKPKINWKAQLERFVSSRLPVDLSMRKPGRRSHALGYYSPTVIKENLDIVVAPDVSGSISQKEYEEMMSETLGIISGFSQVKCTVVPWANNVDTVDVQVFNRGDKDKFLKYRPKNSGGTSLSSLTKYLEDNSIRPEICVVFTDGYIEGDPVIPKCPTICVLTSNGVDSVLKNKVTNIYSLKDID